VKCKKTGREDITILHVTVSHFDGYPKRSKYRGETIRSYKSVIDDVEK